MPEAVRNQQWYVVSRWQEYDGESRANLLRIIAIAGFYLIQLIHFYLLTPVAERDAPFQRSATILAIAWSLIALAIMVCLRRRFFPAALKFVATACDILLLTAVAFLGGGGQSPLVNAYFVILALVALRLNLPLVWYATGGCMLAYVGLVVSRDADWFARVARPIDVPRTEQLVVLLSLLLTGIMLGQMIRRVRHLAEEYERRIAARERGTS